MRRGLLPLVLAGAALAFPAAAGAHATLLQASPRDGSVLQAAPAEARFVFDEAIRVASGVRAVRNGGGSVLRGEPRVVGGKTLVVPLQRLPEGDYTVLWRVVSDDGHTEAGVIAFAVGSGSATPTPSLSASTGPTAREVISRWLLFAGLLVAAGGAFFRFAVGPAAVGVLIPAFVSVFLGASGLLPHHGSLATRFGLAYAVLAVGAAVGALLAAVTYVDRRFAQAAWLTALLLLPAPSFAGHALDPGRPRLEVAVDILHLAAASVWTGGLVQLLLATRASGPQAERLGRFANLALAAVALLGATGILSAFAELSGFNQLWSTGYGRLLLVKTALLGLLVVLGWLGRAHLRSRLDLRRLRRSVSVELVVLAGVVVAVAILTDVRPGRAHVRNAARPRAEVAAPALPNRDAVVLAHEDGDDGVTLAAEPDRTRISVFDGQGLGVNGLSVIVAGKRASPCGAGCYETKTGASGEVSVQVSGRTMTFRVPRSAPDAAALMADATRRFRLLKSVSYVERLASSRTDRIVTSFTLEEPDRLAYRIHGGAAAIVIGTTRWDRTGTKWVRSASSVLPQPLPVWGADVTNAHVLRRTRDAVVVSFLNPNVPAWFLVRFDRHLLPETVDMVATAHFMHHDYTAFNRNRRIYPPRR